MATTASLNFVQNLYIAYYGRPADPLGLSYWAGKVDAAAGNQTTIAGIVNAFGTSTEYTSGLGTQSTASQINTVYQNILGRGADTAGLSYYYNQIANGQLTLAGLAQAVIAGATTGADANAVAGKLTAANAFTNGLTTSTQIINYNSSSTSIAKSWLAGVTDNAGTLTTAQSSLTATITNVTNAGVPTTAATLTTGVDSLTLAGNTTVTAQANSATLATFTAGDTINGGSTTGNKIIITDVGTGGIWNPTGVAGVTVSGVQTATLNSNEGVNANFTGAQGWTGLTTANITTATNGANINTITAAATTALTVTDVMSAQATANSSVTGGSTVSYSVNNGGFDESARTLTVTGKSGTTSVSVVQTNAAAGKDQAVSVLDVNNGTTSAGTITTVTLDGLDTQAATVNSNALSSLTINQVATGGATINVTETANATGLSKTLALGLNTNSAETVATTSAFTGDTIIDTNAQYTTLNVTVGGTSTTAGVNNVNVARFQNFTGVTTMTVAGTGELIDLASAANNATDLAGLTSLSISGTAALSANLANMSGTLTTVSATNTGSNINNLTLSGTAQSYSHTGNARDIITIAARETKSVVAGSATNNEIIFNAAGPGTGVALTNGGTLTGFTVLGTGASSTGTFDLSAITGINSIIVNSGGLAGATSFTNVASGSTLEIDAAAGQTVTYQLAGTAGASNSLNLQLGVAAADLRVVDSLMASTTAGFTATTALAAKDSAGVGVGTLTIVSNATNAGSVNTITNLDDTKLNTLNISGTGGVIFTNNTTAADTATSLTINNTSTSTGASGFATLTDNSLATLTFTGSGLTQITTGMTDNVSALTINQNNTNSNGVTVTAISDNSLNSLTVTGTGALTIGGTSTSTQSLFTLSNTDTASSGLTINQLTDNSLATLSLSGSGKSTITTLADTIASSLTVLDTASGNVTIATLTATSAPTEIFQNTGSGTLTVGSTANTGAAVATLNLLGNVAYTATADAVTGAITVTGGTDNANVTLTFSGAEASGTTDTITLGNGNNSVTFSLQGAATTSVRNVTFGNGNNTFVESVTGANAQDQITVGSGTNSITFNGTTHTVVDSLTFNAANGASTTSLTTVTNALANDTITFANAASNTTVTHLGAVTSVSAGLASASAANGYTDFTTGGNTYIYENTGTAANNELVAIVGTHTIAGTTATSTTVYTLA